MKTNIGIWIDRREAIIVETGNNENFFRMPSKVHEGNVTGGYGGAKKYNAQDAVSDTKMEERRKHGLRDFFNAVISVLPADTDGIFIMGPGETRKLFKNEIANHREIESKIVGMEPADSMTDNQVRAKVKSFFA